MKDKSKYWIEPHIAVYHIHFIEQKMVVDEIIKIKIPARENDTTTLKEVIKGVKVHYISNVSGQTYYATYHTLVLRPWTDNMEEKIKEVQLFAEKQKLRHHG